MAEGESALLIPVPEAEDLVGEWRSLYDPSSAAGVPAHITLLYPFIPRAEIGPETIEELRVHFAKTRAFSVSFPTLARFPGVVYLAPTPDRPIRRMIGQLVEMYPDYPPYSGRFDDFVPHLTIADRRERLDLVLMNRVENGIGPGLPIDARAREVWLMTNRRKRWTKKARFPLRGG
jgi:2'-5' RNA ligase